MNCNPRVQLRLPIWLAAAVFLFPNSTALAGTVIVGAHVHDLSGQSTGRDSDSEPTMDVVADSANDPAYMDVLGAHARAWASAVVVGGVPFKHTGGEGWVTNGNDPKHHYWRANADTGIFEVLGTGMETAELRVRIRATGDPVVLAQAAIAQPPMAPPEVGNQYPSQGFFSENDFEVFFSLDVSVTTGMGTTQLFLGDATLPGPDAVNPDLVETGNMVGVFNVDQTTSPFGQRRLAAFVPLEIVSLDLATTPTNTPFQLNFDQLLTDNRFDVEEPPLVFATPDTFVTSGQMVVELFATDLNDNPLTIRALVPEPSAIVLASFGLVALLLGRRRLRA